jgi:hypothetical protein
MRQEKRRGGAELQAILAEAGMVQYAKLLTRYLGKAAYWRVLNSARLIEAGVTDVSHRAALMETIRAKRRQSPQQEAQQEAQQSFQWLRNDRGSRLAIRLFLCWLRYESGIQSYRGEEIKAD